MRLKTFKLSEITGNIYFMSDLHYNHENILRMGKGRGFSGIEEMNSYILDTLSGTLQKGDILFDLGDLGWKISMKQLGDILGATNGATFYKLLGNHDKPTLYYSKSIRNRFELVTDFLDIMIQDGESFYPISLFHNPIDDYNNMYRGGLHLFGHVHGNFDLKASTENLLRVDVGFDGKLAKDTGSFLIPFSSVLNYFKKKTGGMSFSDWAKKKYKSENENS